MSKNLGHRLREQDAERQRTGQEAVWAREALTPEAYMENEAKIAALFERAKSSVTYAVSRNRTVKRVNMDDAPPFVISGKLPGNPKHPYHHIFRAYDVWGEENGLILDFRYQHDGGGLRGWYEIAFVPRWDLSSAQRSEAGDAV